MVDDWFMTGVVGIEIVTGTAGNGVVGVGVVSVGVVGVGVVGADVVGFVGIGIIGVVVVGVVGNVGVITSVGVGAATCIASVGTGRVSAMAGADARSGDGVAAVGTSQSFGVGTSLASGIGGTSGALSATRDCVYDGLIRGKTMVGISYRFRILLFDFLLHSLSCTSTLICSPWSLQVQCRTT